MQRDVHATGPVVILPAEGVPFAFGQITGRFKLNAAATDGRFAVAQLPAIPPRTLAAPLHRHHNEDEYTFVLDGRLGAMVAGHATTLEPGSWMIKPRGQWHTFWNAADTPCHIVEIVSPAGFETYFQDVAEAEGDLDQLAAINRKYSIDMDFDSIQTLCARFGLTFPSP